MRIHGSWRLAGALGAPHETCANTSQSYADCDKMSLIGRNWQAVERWGGSQSLKGFGARGRVPPPAESSNR